MNNNNSESGSNSTVNSDRKAINFIKRNKMNVKLNSTVRNLKETKKSNTIDQRFIRHSAINKNNKLPRSLQSVNKKIYTKHEFYQGDSDNDKSSDLIIKADGIIKREVEIDPKTWSIGSNVESVELVKAGFVIDKYPFKVARLGIIFNAKNINNDNKYIIKMINKHALSETKDMHNIIEKLELQMRLKNINILYIENIIEEFENIYIIMENASRGSLRSLIRKNPGEISFQQITSYIIQIAKSLKYLHGEGIAHLGISSGNIFLSDSDGDSKDLYSFGIIKLTNLSSGYTHGNCFTDVEYLAPEVIEGKEYCEFKADIWAFGILVFELLTGRIPYTQYVSKESLKKQIVNNKIHFPANIPIPKEAIDLILGMCDKDPSKRSSLEEINNFNWINKLLNFS